jgi:hypothetical protein
MRDFVVASGAVAGKKNDEVVFGLELAAQVVVDKRVDVVTGGVLFN